MIRQVFNQLVKKVFDEELIPLLNAGAQEYTMTPDAFDNFTRVGAQLGLPREQVLMVYLFKHLDGITNHLKGRKSQREPVQGRINDAINYLLLLRGMVEENEGTWPVKPKPDPDHDDEENK